MPLARAGHFHDSQTDVEPRVEAQAALRQVPLLVLQSLAAAAQERSPESAGPSLQADQDGMLPPLSPALSTDPERVADRLEEEKEANRLQRLFRLGKRLAASGRMSLNDR